MPAGRLFIHRMIFLLPGVSTQITFDQEFYADFHWWVEYLPKGMVNRLLLIQNGLTLTSSSCSLMQHHQSDAQVISTGSGFA